MTPQELGMQPADTRPWHSAANKRDAVVAEGDSVCTEQRRQVEATKLAYAEVCYSVT